jgi:MFS family permease
LLVFVKVSLQTKLGYLAYDSVSGCPFFKGHVPDQKFFFLVLGVAEAGLFPGVIYLFSVYYRRHERSWRVAIFFGGAALAGAFGGILAYAIGKMNGVGGRTGWEWYERSIISENFSLTLRFSRIFILEGILTVAISLLAYFIVPTWSHKAKFVRFIHHNGRKISHFRASQVNGSREETIVPASKRGFRCGTY